VISEDGLDRTRRWVVAAGSTVSYEVRVAESLLGDSEGGLLSCGELPGRRFLAIDSGVPEEWRGRIVSYFGTHGVECGLTVVQGGETCKSLEAITSLLSAFSGFGLCRRSEPVIAVGGGAVLDAVGFAASVFRRGVPFIRVPTTLLAYVDASIGVKTAINYEGVKNLVGSFAAPALVLLDRSFFASLGHREIVSGLGEILKVSLGCDAALFDALEELPSNVIEDRFTTLGDGVLTRAIDAMLAQLEGNLLETNLQRPADLGHTFSQVYELSSAGSGFRHGEAVALDLLLSSALALGRGLLDPEEYGRVRALMSRLGMQSVLPDADIGRLWESVQERTRHRDGRQRIPLPAGIGRCEFIDDLSTTELARAVSVAQAQAGAPTALSAVRPCVAPPNAPVESDL
jgi:3-dehydroquinate synthetase